MYAVRFADLRGAKKALQLVSQQNTTGSCSPTKNAFEKGIHA